MSSTTRTRSWRRVKRTVRRRWVQAGLVLLFWLVVLGATVAKLAPKAATKADAANYKYMHCSNDACRFEMPYNADMIGKRCDRCRGKDVKVEGYFEGSKDSVKSGKGAMSPWARVYVIMFVETVAMLALVTYLMYRTVPDPATQFFVITCPYCNQRLRYRAVSHGGQGACSKCKRILRFPEEEDALSEEDMNRADAEAAQAEAAAAQAEADAQEPADR